MRNAYFKSPLEYSYCTLFTTKIYHTYIIKALDTTTTNL